MGGKQIKAGDKVAMWYLSGNRDESAMANANQFIVDRARPPRRVRSTFVRGFTHLPVRIPG